MSTETFPFSVTYGNGIFELSQPTNSNYLMNVPRDEAVFMTHPSVANLYYYGYSGYSICLDYTLCTNLTTASRQAQIEAIQALAISTETVNQGTSPWVTSVTNFPGTQSVTQGTSPWVTSVSNLPATQSVTQGTSPWVSSISNFPATQPVTQSTSPWVSSISNFPGTQSVTQGTSPWVTSNSMAVPVSTDLVGASRLATGTLVTVPAGRTFMGSMSLSASVGAAGNNLPTISVSGAGALPTGTIFQLACIGVAGATSNSNITQDNVFIYGGTAGATVTYTQGALGLTYGNISGRFL